MANSYIEMFEEEFYPIAFDVLASEVIGKFNKEEQKIIFGVKNYLDGYLDDLCKLQEAGLIGTVAQITLSLLYTSLEDGRVEFRIDSYEEGGFLYTNTLLAERFPASWLVEKMDIFEKELEERVVDESLRRYIRPAGVERLKLRALRSLLYYFCSRFRYVIADVLDRKRLAALKKEETFIISMGEYMDWQKVIFALRPEVDIFNCESDSTFFFRRFLAIHYNKKSFHSLDIHHARFTDCTFQDCTIEGCLMNDCIFDGCTFQNVEINHTEMIGCLFIGCSFQKTSLRWVSFYTDSAEKREEYYEPAEFLNCEIKDCRIEHSNLTKCKVKDCDIYNLSMEGTVTESSGFREDDRIVWLDKNQR